MKKIIYISSLIVIIALGYVYLSNQKPTIKPYDESSASPIKEEAENSTDHGNVDKTHAKLAGTRIDLQNQNGLKPGEVMLAFKLYGADAHEFGPNDLKITHEKPMHLILIRDDVTSFQHVHPEYKDGRWTVKTTIENQGLYQMYVDIEPKEESPVTLRVPLTIGGTTQQSQFPSVSANMSAVTNGIQATLQLASPFKTKEHTNLTFVLAQNGKPVTQIDPYLGAFGHVVVLRHGDADDYIHGHPITESKPTDGKVVFESEFPVKGTYTIFAQFSINGQVITFPITVSVDSEGQVTSDHDITTNTNTGEHGNGSGK